MDDGGVVRRKFSKGIANLKGRGGRLRQRERKIEYDTEGWV